MRSILYLEDQAQYGEVIRQLHAMVRKKFHDEVDFCVVDNWHEAAKIVEVNPPSVVLFDLSLKDGWGEDQSIQAIRSTWKTWPPIMVLTGNDYDLGLRRKCITAGADSFMLKTEANRSPELLCERIYNCYLRRLRDATRA